MMNKNTLYALLSCLIFWIVLFCLFRACVAEANQLEFEVLKEEDHAWVSVSEVFGLSGDIHFPLGCNKLEGAGFIDLNFRKAIRATLTTLRYNKADLREKIIAVYCEKRGFSVTYFDSYEVHLCSLYPHIVVTATKYYKERENE